MDLISGLRNQAAESKSGVHPDVIAAFSLEGRTAVVTGAARGIGQQTAVTYAKAGARVVIADRLKEGLAETEALIGDGVVVVPTDVSDKTAVDDLARQAVHATGRIDVWANVAGVINNFMVIDATPEDVKAILDVNLMGVYWGCAAAGRVMSVAGSGAIVNVASAGGETPAPSLSAYGISKAGVIQLTRIVAAELGPKGVRANSVAPGYIETPMTARVWTNPDGSINEETRKLVLDGMTTRQPIAINGTTQDIAWTMLWLAVDASRFITGQVLRPNGGIFMS
jgi:3-oxoacyl-[acyl-carrier protein] reductase